MIPLSIFLFVVGILWSRHGMRNYIHEAGHVVFAFFTGGRGEIVSGTMALTNGGSYVMMCIGGALFSAMVGTFIYFLTLRKKLYWIGAPFLGAAYFNLFFFYSSVDRAYAGVSILTWTIVVVLFIGFHIWLTIRYTKKTVAKKTNKVYNPVRI